MSLPWLAPSYEQFSRLLPRLPHAILIYGDPGVGKDIFAKEVISTLLCDERPQASGLSRACGQCKNCAMLESNNHPDFHYLSSEWFAQESTLPHIAYTERYLEPLAKRAKRKPRRVISVDQVRSLIADFALSHHSASKKVALIQPADAMNTNASNALLKLLEEPNPDSVLILVCDDPSRLPMTIRSRCVSLVVNAPRHAQSLAWLVKEEFEASLANKALAIAGGSPLRAKRYIETNYIDDFETLISALNEVLNEGASAIQARERVLKLQPPELLFKWLQLVMSWLIANTDSSHENINPLAHCFKTELAQLVGKGLNKQMLFSLYDDLVSARRQDVNILSPALLLDKWLITLSQRLKSV